VVNFFHDGSFSQTGFQTWIAMVEGWAWVVGAFIIVVPVAWEVRTIQAGISSNKKASNSDDTKSIASLFAISRIASSESTNWRRPGTATTRVNIDYDDQFPTREPLTTTDSGRSRFSVLTSAASVYPTGNGLVSSSERIVDEQVYHKKPALPITWDDQKKRLGF
jgi:hypothetical protein